MECHSVTTSGMTFWVKYLAHIVKTLQKWSQLQFKHSDFQGRICIATNEAFFGIGNPLTINPKNFFFSDEDDTYRINFPLIEFAVVSLEIGDLRLYSNGYPICIHFGLNSCTISHWWHSTGEFPEDHPFPDMFETFCKGHDLDHLCIDGSCNRTTMTLQEADRLLKALLFGNDAWHKHPGILLEAIAT